ncbi:E3 ubiquitin-protein ligase RNF4-like [Venturia canescens]|uniref:E3 ubiquitin-protein ligase RNF4-like n=1 Tax=Venturia canescens TaxID=32260 RepID=UPI001C9D65B8|nr:E3 ubiquitin-protein ligase RNF4-like [Venturia canescens]
MEQKLRNPVSHSRADRTTAAVSRRSPPPEYFVDLTVDSPVTPRPRAPLRRSRSLRRHQHNSSQQAASSQTATVELPDLELIDHSNRLLPLKKRNRTSKSTQETPVIELDDSTPSEATRVNDSMNGESMVLTCPICFEYLTSKRKPTSTRCGHLYCAECIEQTLSMSKKCPKCQSSITPKSCIRLYF